MASLFQNHVNQWKDCRRCALYEGRKNVVLARGSIPADILFVGEAPGTNEDRLAQPFIGPAGHLLDQIIGAVVQEYVPRSVQEGKGFSPTFSCCFTNLIACIPKEDREHGGQKLTKPPKEAVIACMPRLTEFIRICRPKLICCVGGEARDWFDPKAKRHVEVPKFCSVCHWPQKHSPGGWVCKNGHGGADPYAPETGPTISAAGVSVPAWSVNGMPVIDIVHPAHTLRLPMAHQPLAVRRSIITIKNAVEKYL